jgi:hypothetical protein
MRAHVAARHDDILRRPVRAGLERAPAWWEPRILLAHEAFHVDRWRPGEYAMLREAIQATLQANERDALVR